MRLADILDICGAKLVTVSPKASLAETVRTMHAAEAIGVMVRGEEGLRGILTRDDIFRYLTTTTPLHRAWEGPVAAAIAERPGPLGPEEPVGQVIARMTETGIDHIQVATAQGIVVVSLSNLLLAENSFLHGELQHLQKYIDALHDAPND